MFELFNPEFTFHWIRPNWLWALIPVALLFILLWRNSGTGGSWSKVISADLLPFLIDAVETKKSRYPIAILFVVWIIATIAMAGPAVKKIPVPVYQKEDAAIILLDLSPSMLAGDTAPSRIVQARREVLDLLRRRKEGLTALIVYSGDAFIVSPLTNDTETIALLVPNLAPTSMPSIGNNPLAALTLANNLRAGAGIDRAKLIWITDELPIDDYKEIEKKLSASKFDVAIMGMGTKNGAPIPLANGGFLKDNNSAVVIPKLNESVLKDMASDVNGIYRRSVVSDSDIKDLIDYQPELELADSTEILSQEFDAWRDEAPWLALLLLPFVAIGFRKGWLLGLALFFLPLEQADALTWDELWQTKNQQAAQAFNEGDAEKAAELFDNLQWKAAAKYQAEQYEDASTAFIGDSPDSHYNKANALAKAGKIEEAKKEYDKALKLNPTMEDALFNKAILDSLPPPPESDQENQSGDNENSEDNSDEKQSDQNQESDENNNGENESENQDQNGEQESSDDESTQEQSESENNTPDQQSDENNSDGKEEPSDNESQPDQESNADEANTDEQELAANNEEAQDTELSDEENNAIEQQLRMLSDNPGELLRRKFEYQYQQRANAKNNGEQRW